MSKRRNNTASLLTLAVALALLTAMPLMAQDAATSEVPDTGSQTSDDGQATLVSSEPILGKQVDLAAMNFSPDGSAYVFMSLTPDQFVPVDQNHSIYIDLDSYVSFGAYRVERDGVVVVPIELPEIPQMRGMEISVQAACLPLNGALELTNGLIWTLVY